MLKSFPTPITACVFGASGGIGRALTQALLDDPAVARVFAGARRGSALPAAPAKLHPFAFDLGDEASIAAAAATMAAEGPVHLIIIATGLLHEDGALKPEKSFKMQTPEAYARAFAVNTIGPALIGKHCLPLLPRGGKCVFAALSARVGSISDNRLGGWHAYRASKAALNMVVRNFALEISVRNPDALAVTLHPGTVATGLSAPFQAGVNPEALFASEVAAAHLLMVIDALTPVETGQLIAWNGAPIAF
jgi:NAD(P)-dependent dehydrogenase (short-subunit alcohol dehydrogenase family)